MLTIGALLVCVAILTLAVVAPVFRRSDPPQWTTRRWVGELVTLGIVCTLAIGLGYFGAGVIDTFRKGPDYFDLALLAGVLLVTVAIWRQWARRTRVVVSGSTAAPSGGQGATAEPVAGIQAPPPHRAA